MAIQFASASKSSSTVSKLLDTVLPGHSIRTEKTSAVSSKSQIINTAQKKLKPEEVRRLQKKEKLVVRQQVKDKREQRERVESVARYELLQQHAKDGKLTLDEKKELKRLINKNIVSVQSWRTDAEDEMVDVQKQILELKKTDYANKKSKKKQSIISAQNMYKKKLEKKYPGLTPGLAPVGMSDSDTDDE